MRGTKKFVVIYSDHRCAEVGDIVYIDEPKDSEHGYTNDKMFDIFGNDCGLIEDESFKVIEEEIYNSPLAKALRE
jgi:hypothetical protein